MTPRRQWIILGALGAAYLVGVGVLAGIVSERFRFDGVRNDIVRQLEDATERVHSRAMAWEHEVQESHSANAAPRTEPAPARTVTWVTHLEALDAALARRDVHGAERAWREAYGAATRTRAWRPLLDVGDAALRIGTLEGHRKPYEMRARETYLAALARARAERSMEGVLHVAESFDALGDHAVVEQCLIIAEGLGAARDRQADSRVRALTNGVANAHATPSIVP